MPDLEFVLGFALGTCFTAAATAVYVIVQEWRRRRKA